MTNYYLLYQQAYRKKQSIDKQNDEDSFIEEINKIENRIISINPEEKENSQIS